MKIWKAAAAVALVVAAASGCASSTSDTGGAITSSPAPVAQVPGVISNPVTILRKAHASTSAVYGQVDVWGDRYAVGYYPEDGVAQGEQVYVYTFDSAAAQQADLDRNSTPQDGQELIKGDLFDVSVIGMPNLSGGWSYTVSPAAVAILVGGKVVSP